MQLKYQWKYHEYNNEKDCIKNIIKFILKHPEWGFYTLTFE